MKKFTEHTITDFYRFPEYLSEIPERHYALDKEEHKYNVYCVTVILGNEQKTPN